MTHACTEQGNLPHAAFLKRFAGAASSTSPDARLGNGAFLALRLVDLLGPGDEPAHPDAFRYQHAATARMCRELPVGHTETAHVTGVVGAAVDAFHHQDVRIIVPALLAYAHYLEDELRLEEALDVLSSVLRVAVERLASSDAIATHLRVGRVNRKLNRFDQGDGAYATAAELAEHAGDVHSAFLSRVGQAISTQARGNLAESERLFRELAVAARAASEREIEAHAQHGLGATFFFRGQVAEGIVSLWRAFELYEDESSRVRALGDLGTMLLTLGEVVAAERALDEVARRGDTMRDVATNAMIELMHCASFRRDRVGFARWRSECEARTASMPPNILADFCLKTGIGQARFGRLRQAEDSMVAALSVAESAGLNELVFRIERIKSGLRGCGAECTDASDAAAEPVPCTADVRGVSESLARLRQ